MRKMNNYQSSLKEQYVEELAIGDVFRFVFLGNNLSLASSVMVGVNI